mgnify:CR=1 FL=1
MAYGSSRKGNNGGSGGGATGYYSNEVGGNSTQNQYIYNGIQRGYNNNIFGIGTYVYGGIPDNNISDVDNPKFTIDKLIFYDKPLTEKEITIEYNFAIIS